MSVGECDCDDGYIGSDCSTGMYIISSRLSSHVLTD